MDIREILNGILEELDIKCDDIYVQSEISAIKKQIKESLDAINEISNDKPKYLNDRKKERYILKIFLPYMIYMHHILETIPGEIPSDLNKDYITEILQKHLQALNNN